MLVDAYEFLALVNSQDSTEDAVQLLTVSNGSDDAGSMTFGWVIALPGGRRLFRCSGPAFGPTGSSFCAEGYRFLSVTCFLLRLCDFCLVAPTWTIRMLTDNQGLLTRIASGLPHKDPFPNLTLAPDWDLTNEIIVGLQAMGKTPQLCHVKGHQDEHTAYDHLPLEAQLNVDADIEAGYYQCMHPSNWPVIPRLPSNLVQLHVLGKVVCSRLKRTIREASTISVYFTYATCRFKWTPEVTTTIDWAAYVQAISRFPTKRTQITKLCNDLLLTARWANRYDTLTTEH